MEKSPLVHIGYPKTATSWFQEVFYPDIINSHFVKRNDFFRVFIKPDVFSFEPRMAREYFEINKDRIIICEELLLGGIDIGYGDGSYIKEMSSRLKKTFPDARIVIFIRNQIDAIASWYYQYIRSGGTYSINNYLYRDNFFNLFFKEYSLFSFKILEYHNIINLYSSLFGRENVDVYLYEDFMENRNDFMDSYINRYNLNKEKSLQDLGCEVVNSRYRSCILELARFTNRFSNKKQVFKHYFFHVPLLYEYSRKVFNKLNNYTIFGTRATNQFILGEKNIQYIKNYYRDSNRRLLNDYGLSVLKKYDYPL